MMDKKGKKTVERKLGIYKHYKNKREYQLLSIGINSETQAEEAIYQSLTDQKIWVRPADIFFEEVEVDGQKMPRFAFVSEIEDKDKKSFEDLYKRALADYQNLQRQAVKEKEEFAKYANEMLLYEILPIYDHLKMAVNHADENNKDAWLEGVRFVVKQFAEALSNVGVEEIKTVGEKFDHHTMEALESKEIEDKKMDEIVEREIKAGYKLNGKVIMAAKVAVYKTVLM